MAHTDRQPSDKIFADILNACHYVWANGNYVQEYKDEKIKYIYGLTNYADNWFAMVGIFDLNNQRLMYWYIEYQETIDFLRTMCEHYHMVAPREKK